MNNIEENRQPLERIDKRGWNTTIFWGTQKIQTKTINLNIIDGKYNKIKTYIEYIIVSRSKRGETIDTHNFRTILNPKTNKIYFFKQIIASNHGIKYKKIKYIEYTDNRNNTFYICINKNTTNFTIAQKVINTLRQIAETLKISRNTYLRALFLSEIFICLATQLWHAIKHNSKSFIEKLIDIITISAYFIIRSGLLYDKIFLSMTGHLGKYKQQFYKIPLESRKFNISNQNLYFDTYYNISNSKKNFLSREYSNAFNKKLALYFNDSCIIDTSISKKDWTKNMSNDKYTSTENKTILGEITNKLLFYNYGFFILKTSTETQFINGVIPNEMGRIYVTNNELTPQSFIIHILNNSIQAIKKTSQTTKSENIKQFLKQIKHLKIKGLTK